jgi:hypothetical protein
VKLCDLLLNFNIFLIIKVHDIVGGDGDNLFLRLFHLMMLTYRKRYKILFMSIVSHVFMTDTMVNVTHRPNGKLQVKKDGKSSST